MFEFKEIYYEEKGINQYIIINQRELRKAQTIFSYAPPNN